MLHKRSKIKHHSSNVSAYNENVKDEVELKSLGQQDTNTEKWWAWQGNGKEKK